ncbi:MAG: WxcM-like domain-containing protein [Sphingobacteriaceae bacterium]|nr:WxcM-like domain-containing protein [Sphingobacteriaceae bacterium]
MEDKKTPQLLKGGLHSDHRGELRYNNLFDAADIRRMYVIENKDTDLVRAWQGHRIEQRWFSAIQGRFKIQLIAIDNWENTPKNLKPITFELNATTFDVLYVPNGYANSVQALDENAKLLVMADHPLGTKGDEYRYATDYFVNE